MNKLIGELVSRTLFGFGEIPPEWCGLQLVHEAVVACYNTRLKLARISDKNVLLSITDSFAPQLPEHDVTELINAGSPVYAEEICGHRYPPVRIVNLNALSKYAGQKACAFYTLETEDGAKQMMRLSDCSAPQVMRIHFDRDANTINLDTPVSVPDDVTELVVLEAQNKLIPRIKIKAVLEMRRVEEDRKVAEMMIALLDGVYKQNALDIAMLMPIWNTWAYREQGNQGGGRNFNRPVPSGKGLYG